MSDKYNIECICNYSEYGSDIADFCLSEGAAKKYLFVAYDHRIDKMRVYCAPNRAYLGFRSASELLITIADISRHPCCHHLLQLELIEQYAPPRRWLLDLVVMSFKIFGLKLREDNSVKEQICT